jgi:hypothetical protein
MKLIIFNILTSMLLVSCSINNFNIVGSYYHFNNRSTEIYQKMELLPDSTFYFLDHAGLSSQDNRGIWKFKDQKLYLFSNCNEIINISIENKFNPDSIYVAVYDKDNNPIPLIEVKLASLNTEIVSTTDILGVAQFKNISFSQIKLSGLSISDELNIPKITGNIFILKYTFNYLHRNKICFDNDSFLVKGNKLIPENYEKLNSVLIR